MSIVSRVTANKPGLIASLAAVAALALTSTYTLGGFSATIADSSSSFSSATIQLKEGQRGHDVLFDRHRVRRLGHGHQHQLHLFHKRPHRDPGPGAGRDCIDLDDHVDQCWGQERHPGQSGNGACAQAAASDDSSYMRARSMITRRPERPTSACTRPRRPLSNTYTLASWRIRPHTSRCRLWRRRISTYVISVQLDTAAANNADQGLTATFFHLGINHRGHRDGLPRRVYQMIQQGFRWRCT